MWCKPWLAVGIGLCASSLFLGCNAGDDDDDDNTDPDTTLLPSQVCGNLAYDTCAKLAECASADQLRSLGYPNSDSCLGEAMEQLGCASASQLKVCQGAQNATSADTATCTKQVQAASCADVSTKPVANYATGCGQCAFRP